MKASTSILALFAFANVAVSSVPFSSEVPSVDTSVFVSISKITDAPPSTTDCKVTVTVSSDVMTIQTSTPSSTPEKSSTADVGSYSYPASPPPVLSTSITFETSIETETVVASSTAMSMSLPLTSATVDDPTTVAPSAPSTRSLTSTIHKNTSTIYVTGTGAPSASTSYSAPPPEFTAAAAGLQIGAAILFGGVAMAAFGA